MADKKPLANYSGSIKEVNNDSLVLRANNQQLKIQEVDNADKQWSLEVDGSALKVTESGVGTPLALDAGLPNDFMHASVGGDYDEFSISSTRGSRLRIAGDTDDITETDTPRIVFTRDGALIGGTIGTSGSGNVDGDGITMTGAQGNEYCIHNPTGSGLALGVNNKAYFKLDDANNGELTLLGEGAFDSGFFVRFGDLDMGICEYTDDNLRIHAENILEISSDNVSVHITNIATANSALSGVSIAEFNFGSDIALNSSSQDIDLKIKKNIAGDAYTYDAGTDTHTWDAPADKTLLTNQPTGGTALAIATTQYVDNAVGLKSIITTTDASYTVLSTDYTILVDSTGGDKTVNLPAAASNNERILNIKKIDASANTVTVDGNASETIDGSLTAVLVQSGSAWPSITIQSNGTSWFII